MTYNYFDGVIHISIDLSRVLYVTENRGTVRVHLDNEEVIEFNYAARTDAGYKIRDAWQKFKGRVNHA